MSECISLRSISMRVHILAALLGFCLVDSLHSSNSTKNGTVFRWMENLVNLPMPSGLDQYLLTNDTGPTKGLGKLIPLTVSDELKPFINQTALHTAKTNARNVSRTKIQEEDEIITDEDVADISDEESEINTSKFDGKKTTVTISTEAGTQMYQHWLDQAVSGLMAAYATNKIDDVSAQMKKAHNHCTNTAKSVTAHAKCVAELLEEAETNPVPKQTETKDTIKKSTGKRRKISKKTNHGHKTKKVSKKMRILQKYGSAKRIGSIVKKKKKTGVKNSSRKTRTEAERLRKSRKYLKNAKRITLGSHVGSFRRRMKREISLMESIKPVQKSSYSLIDGHENSPFAMLARKLTDTVRAFKNKGQDHKSWQRTIDEIQEEGEKLKKKQRAKKLIKKRFEMFTQAMQDVGVDPTGALETMNINFYKDEPVKTEHEELMEEVEELEKKMSPEDKILRQPIKLIREGVKIGMALTGQDVSNFDNKTIKMVSPKLMSLVPEKEKNNNTINLLSPNLFSLHNESGPHETLNLAKMFDVFAAEGQQEWMNFIIEASGVSDAVTYMKDIKKKEERDEIMEKMRGKDGTPLYFNKDNVTEISGDFERKKVERMEKLNSMFTEEQMASLNRTGYVLMTPDQLEFFYGPLSPYNNSEALDRFNNVSAEHIPEVIESTVNLLAKEELAFRVQRKKDIILSPIVLTNFISDPVGVSQALILSPVLLSPLVYSPAIFGSVILSPWAFVPVIASPRLLSPTILSPVLFSPVILSPLLMVPLILSPGVGVPFILSPFLLSPFILSPVALTPVILSPFALSPFIMIPNVLSPLILSPFVLSPLILSPPAFSAFILNPYALSPIIKSDGVGFTAVLSPSWLS